MTTQPESIRRLSSQATFLHKRVFPVVWVGGIAALAISAAREAGLGYGVWITGPAVMAVGGLFIWMMLVRDLVDEVLDAGDALVVRNSGKEERISLLNIEKVSWLGSSPERITLSLRSPSVFGKEIIFSPPFRAPSFSTHPIAAELMARVEQTGGR